MRRASFSFSITVHVGGLRASLYFYCLVEKHLAFESKAERIYVEDVAFVIFDDNEEEENN